MVMIDVNASSIQVCIFRVIQMIQCGVAVLEKDSVIHFELRLALDHSEYANLN